MESVQVRPIRVIGGIITTSDQMYSSDLDPTIGMGMFDISIGGLLDVTRHLIL